MSLFRSIIIAGVRSGCGKTTLSSAIMATLKEDGYVVQPFKVGPDYIDPAFHRYICERPSYNLDSWIMGLDGVRNTFFKATEGADFAVIEGVMGLFDGKADAPTPNKRVYYGSTAHIASILGIPLILIVDATAMAQSVGAIIYGFKHYVKDLNI
ncbi:MAG: cobyrinic acid a,c-diamide synthase, partial [Nitrospirae bacterium]